MVIQQERENSSKILPQVTVENGISTASVAHYLAEPYLNFKDQDKLYITTDETDPAVAGTALEGSYLDRFNQLIKLIKGEPLKTSGQTVTVTEVPRFIVFYADDLDALGNTELLVLKQKKEECKTFWLVLSLWTISLVSLSRLARKQAFMTR